MEERLQKILAAAGVASRRKAEEIIAAGRVSVNGRVVTEMGAQADLGRDKILVDGEPLLKKERRVYILMNKPEGYLCTVTDTHERKTVLDLLEDNHYRLFPVGRLDMDTSGLLLLTNDGKFMQQVLHPSAQIEKLYRVRVKGLPDSEQIKQLKEGVAITIDEQEVTVKADNIRFLTRKGRESIWEVSLHQGKKRQIRLMFRAIECPVLSLSRTRIGNLTAEGLKEGEWRYLKNSEVRELVNQGRPKQQHEQTLKKPLKKPQEQRSQTTYGKAKNGTDRNIYRGRQR